MLGFDEDFKPLSEGDCNTPINLISKVRKIKVDLWLWKVYCYQLQLKYFGQWFGFNEISMLVSHQVRSLQ